MRGERIALGLAILAGLCLGAPDRASAAPIVYQNMIAQGNNVPDLGTGTFTFSYSIDDQGNADPTDDIGMFSAFNSPTNSASGAFQDGFDGNPDTSIPSISFLNISIGFEINVDDLTIANSGTLAGGSGLIVSQCIDTPINCITGVGTTQNLITATALGVGFAAASPTNLNILWDISGGSLQPEFQGNFETAALVNALEDDLLFGQFQSTGFNGLTNGDFRTAFSGGGATVDHQGTLLLLPVPPALPMLVGALGLLGFAGYRRRRAES